MKYLGSNLDSKIFKVTNETRDTERQNLFVSQIYEVQNNPEERRKVLEDLGYDFFDFDLWKGWLFLEESSSEVIIRDYLIEWFIPSLKNKIRTFSAGGASKIETKFEDFDRLFVFLHLEPTYKNKVWVKIDAGEDEGKIIEKMKNKYEQAGWNESNFGQFKEHDFEKYYPTKFQERVANVIIISNKQERRTAKKALLVEVKAWIEQGAEEAKNKFSESAHEVIEYLRTVNNQLNG